MSEALAMAFASLLLLAVWGGYVYVDNRRVMRRVWVARQWCEELSEIVIECDKVLASYAFDDIDARMLRNKIEDMRKRIIEESQD